MHTTKEQKLLRIHISSTDKFRHSPLYEVVIFSAKRHGISGATVLKGIMGYGSSNSQISASRYWEFTEKLPVIVELIDTPEKIESFLTYILPWFSKVKTGCIITTEKVNVVFQKSGKK